MKIQQVTWECPACEGQNPTHIPKPKALQPVTLKKKCESCDSEFLMKFSRKSSESVTMELLGDKLSDKGLARHKLKEHLKGNDDSPIQKS